MLKQSKRTCLTTNLSVAAVTQAETQLANTSLNGIDLFNTISDDTTIPTVVESLNAQIEESCHSTTHKAGEDSSPNVHIKREEEECKCLFCAKILTFISFKSLFQW